jgi:uncharacterized protein YgbK (DUF1537 family)
MYMNVNQKMAQLPPEFKEELLPSIREEFTRSRKTIIVLDDDPTGTQTCYDVTVLTSWDVDLIAGELKKQPSILFILTNSRSLTETQAIDLAIEIGKNLKEAVKESGREIIVISRSDSTLRGHFLAEVDAIASELDLKDAVIVLVPAFIEGGRLTIDDVHYLVEDKELVPVSETPFAKDVAFGYKNAHLKQWVEEKTKGRISATEVSSISIEDVRVGGPHLVSGQLKKVKAGAVCIANAASYKDLEIIAMGLILAENSGKKFLYRTSATIVPIRAGLRSGKIFIPQKEDVISKNGALVIVGSHVPKSTKQLTHLLATGNFKSIEVNVKDIIGEQSYHTEAISKQTDALLALGNNVVIHTSRKLEAGMDAESSLKINALASDFLVRIIKGLSVRPKFIIAKGGITSSDLASKGLSVKRAEVLGAIIPGVPVWRLDAQAKFPGIIYVVFPGNVGNDAALEEVCRELQ